MEKKTRPKKKQQKQNPIQSRRLWRFPGLAKSWKTRRRMGERKRENDDDDDVSKRFDSERKVEDVGSVERNWSSYSEFSHRSTTHKRSFFLYIIGSLSLFVLFFFSPTIHGEKKQDGRWEGGGSKRERGNFSWHLSKVFRLITQWFYLRWQSKVIELNRTRCSTVVCRFG